MKKNLVFIALLAIFLAACQNSELPPEPGTPGEGEAQIDAKTGAAVQYVPEGYAPPQDVFDNDTQIFFLDKYVVNAQTDDDSIFLRSSVEQDGGFVYKRGYYYSVGQQKWIPYTFPQETVRGSNWIRESSEADLEIPLQNNLLPGENYILAYSCKKYDGEWKCGCRSENDCGYWMLNTFTLRTDDLPPEPEEPNSPVLLRLWLWPDNQIVESRNITTLGARVETSWDICEEIKDDGFTFIIEWPNGTVTQSESTSVRGPVYGGEEEIGKFSCSVDFFAEFTPEIDGDYRLKFSESDLDMLPEYNRIFEGDFRAYDPALINNILIRENIGNFRYRFGEDFGWYGEDDEVFFAQYVISDYSGANVYIVKGGLFSDNFEDWKLNAEGESIDVDGVDYIVYYLEDDGANAYEIQWKSQRVVVRISVRQEIPEDDILLMIRAYLRRYPSQTTGDGNDGGSGEFYKYEGPGNKLFFYQQLTATLSAAELNALSDGTFRGKSTETYKQRLNAPADAEVVWGTDDDFGQDPQLLLNFEVGEIISYYLTFPNAVLSDVDSNGHLEDFEDNKITILGKEYTVVDATYFNGAKFTLMRGAVADTLQVGETKMYAIGRNKYGVTVQTASGDTAADARAKFIINGQETTSLGKGEIYTLRDGLRLGIMNILPTKSGDLVENIVEFYLGAEKIVLDDYDKSIGINDKRKINDAYVGMLSVTKSDVLALHEIKIYLFPGRQNNVPIGGSLSESVREKGEDDHQEFLAAFGLDYKFTGKERGQRQEIVSLGRYTDNTLRFTFTNKNGVTYDFPLFSMAAEGAEVKLGDVNNNLILDEGSVICDEDYFAVESNGISRVLRLADITNTSQAHNVKIRDMGTGDLTNYDFDVATGQAEIPMDGDRYLLTVVGKNTPTCVVATDIVNIQGRYERHALIWTQFGSRFNFTPGALDASDKAVPGNIFFLDNINAVGSYAWNVTWDSSSQNIDITDIKQIASKYSKLNMITLDSNPDITEGYNKCGTFFRSDTGGDHDVWHIYIPESRVTANVYLTFGDVDLPDSD